MAISYHVNIDSLSWLDGKVGCVFAMVIVSILPHDSWAMRNSDEMTIGEIDPTLFLDNSEEMTVYKRF